MRRITISIPGELADALKREARRQHIPVSQLAREAIENHLGRPSGQPRSLQFVALGRSGHQHTGRDFEDILATDTTNAGDR